MMTDVKEKRDDVNLFPCLCRYDKNVIGLLFGLGYDDNFLILKSENPKISIYTRRTVRQYEITRLGKGSSFTFTQE